MSATSTAYVGRGRTKSWALARQPLIDWTAESARDFLGDNQREGVFPTDEKEYVTRVQTKSGIKVGHGKERSVKLGGQIWYSRFKAEEDWVPAALALIALVMRQTPFTMKMSRTLRGWRRRHYRHSFVLLHNNRLVVPAGYNFGARASQYIERQAQNATNADVFSIVNIQPYARRVDMGAPGQTPWSTQAPRGVLKRAASEAKSRKATKNIEVDYTMRPLPGGIADSESQRQGSTVSYAERRRSKGRWAYSGRIMRKHRVYPTIHFSPPKQGASERKFNVPWTHRPTHYHAERLGTGGIVSGPDVRGMGASLRGGVRVNIRRAR